MQLFVAGQGQAAHPCDLSAGARGRGAQRGAVQACVGEGRVDDLSEYGVKENLNARAQSSQRKLEFERVYCHWAMRAMSQ